ncbi:MAG: hypothetical protein GX995_08710 [Clostridiales bacterium]|nr:hypothetical protein [Clostridiales bacterium]
MWKRKVLSILLILTILLSSNYGKVSASSSNSSLKRNVYYAYGMSAEQLAAIDAKKYMITHICYAFFYLTPESDGKLTSKKDTTPSSSSSYYVDSTTSAKLKALAGLKSKYPWLKILISIGGSDDKQTERFVTVASNEKYRKQLGVSCRDLINAYNLDGIDLDWEHPENTSEANNYRRICRDIRGEIGGKGEGKLLTAAVPISSSFVNTTMADQIKPMNDYLDFWNLMTYDLGSSSRYSFVAPYERKSGSESYGFSSVVEGIDMYYKKGIEYADMNLGVPFYGKMLT